jgi:hypothetical protein
MKLMKDVFEKITHEPSLFNVILAVATSYETRRHRCEQKKKVSMTQSVVDCAGSLTWPTCRIDVSHHHYVEIRRERNEIKYFF